MPNAVTQTWISLQEKINKLAAEADKIIDNRELEQLSQDELAELDKLNDQVYDIVVDQNELCGVDYNYISILYEEGIL